MVCPFRMCGHSRSMGSFTFMIMSADFHTDAASGRIVAPACSYSASGKPLPSPAPVSMRTLCPASASTRAPAGTRATRFSFVLISFGTPICMVLEGVSVNGDVDRRRLVHVARRSAPSLSARAAGTEAHDRLAIRCEEIPADSRDGVGIDRVDAGQHFVERLIRLIVQLRARRLVHPRRNAVH